jgi:lysine 2,3-aminomutase
MSAEVLTTQHVWREFLADLGYDLDSLPHLQTLREKWPHPPRVSAHLAKRIHWEDPSDPLLLQVVPLTAEKTVSPNELLDPIGDHVHEVPGVGIHRYRDRLLVWPHMTCNIHCRFCFRREDVGGKSGINWAKVKQYLAEHSEIEEVILSGGDPGVLTAKQLDTIVTVLLRSKTVKKMRLHSRILITDPNRISPEYLEQLQKFTDSDPGRTVIWMHHVNHAQEISPESATLAQKLKDLGMIQRSQSVLLRGINAEVDTLEKLYRELLTVGITPHYLHHLDQAQGTGHFRLSIQEGLAIFQELKRRLPECESPKYILDLPGGFGKVQVIDLREVRPGVYQIISPVTGEVVAYHDPAHTHLR